MIIDNGPFASQAHSAGLVDEDISAEGYVGVRAVQETVALLGVVALDSTAVLHGGQQAWVGGAFAVDVLLMQPMTGGPLEPKWLQHLGRCII